MSTATVPSPPELATLEIEIDGDVGTLTLNRPDSLNAMSPELIGELTVAAAWLADRAPLRALIVTGAGRGVFGRRRRQLVQARPRGSGARSAVRRPPRRRRPSPGDRRLPPDPVSGDRRDQRRRRRGRVLARADVRHPDRVRRGGVRLRLRADRRLARRRHDLLPAAGGRARRRRSSCCSPTRSSAPTRRSSSGSSPRSCPPTSSRGGSGEGPRARRQGAALRPDVEAAGRREPHEHPCRPPPGRAPRDRRLDGDRGPRERRHRVLRGA